MKVFVLQAQGFGDNENEFYNIGVYKSPQSLAINMTKIREELDFDVEFKVEEYEVE